MIIKIPGTSFLAMSLKKVYDQHVKIDKVIQEIYNTKMVRCGYFVKLPGNTTHFFRISEEMVLGIREKSPLLNAMNSKTFCRGSHKFLYWAKRPLVEVNQASISLVFV